MKAVKSIVACLVVAASSHALADGSAAGCALAGGVARGDSSIRSIAGQVYNSAVGGYSGYGGSDCLMNEVAPYAADRAIDSITGDGGESGYSQTGQRIRQVGSAAMYGGSDGAKNAAQAVGVEILLDKVFGN